MVKIYTAQYRYKGNDRVDITAAGKTELGKFFMPDWSLVNGLKNGVITEEQYEREYHLQMVESWRTNRHAWHNIMERDEVTLVCFCPPGAFCHRVLLAQYLEKCGGVYKGERDLTNGQQDLFLNMSILDVEEGIVCHQVNCQGVMGAGLALQIRKKWPIVYDRYRKYVAFHTHLLGKLQLVTINNDLIVANIFGQDRYGRIKRYTDYNALRSALNTLAKWLDTHLNLTGQKMPVYFPVGMSCKLAGGDWYLVKSMIKNIIPDANFVKYNR